MYAIQICIDDENGTELENKGSKDNAILKWKQQNVVLDGDT
jgi:hypothetical protein